MIGVSGDWTVECHFKGKAAEVVALYDRLRRPAVCCGLSTGPPQAPVGCSG
jgi:hypothetical protein